MMHCITKCSGLENAAMVLIHTSIVSIVDTSCICKLGTITHIRNIHISHCGPSCTVIIFTSHWTTDGFPISIFPKFPCFVHIQDTSCRQVMYLKSKITKLGAPEAFRTMQSVPCQRLMGH